MEAKSHTENTQDHNFNNQIENFGRLVGNLLSSAKPDSIRRDAHSETMMLQLHSAIVNEDLEKVKELCSEINLNEKFTEQPVEAHAGITPLALACALCKVQVAAILVEHGADVNMPFAALNTTSLMTSAYHGHIEIVKLLLTHGADVRAVDLQQSTALGYAFGGTRNTDVVRLLLKYNIDVNQKNMLGMNALLLVAGYGNPDLVRMILNAGADANAVNDFGHTALHLAVVGKQDMIRKIRALGSQEAVDADRSLNRRNLDVAVQEWARLHRDAVGGTKEDQEALARAGKIMMSIGHQLGDTPVEEGEDQNGLERRVRAVWKHRQEKLKQAKEKRKSGIWNLLSCGGGKSKQAEKSGKENLPMSPLPKDPNKKDHEDPQISTLSESFAHILRMIIDAGCQIDCPDKTFGMTALDLAILNGDVESSAVLASAGGDPDHFPKMIALKEFYQAVVFAQNKEIKNLLTYDEDLDVNLPLSRFNVDSEGTDEGLMPLALVAKHCDLETVKAVLKKGANVNDGGPSGRYAVNEAVIADKQKMVEVLMAQGADIELPSQAKLGATTVNVAILEKKHVMVDFLIKKGAKVDKPLADGREGLIKAWLANDMDMMDLILEADMEKNFVDPNSFTYIMAKHYQGSERDMEAMLKMIAEKEQELEKKAPPSPRIILDNVPNAALSLSPPVQQNMQVQGTPQQKAVPPVPQQTPPQQSQMVPSQRSPDMVQAEPLTHSTPEAPLTQPQISQPTGESPQQLVQQQLQQPVQGVQQLVQGVQQPVQGVQQQVQGVQQQVQGIQQQVQGVQQQVQGVQQQVQGIQQQVQGVQRPIQGVQRPIQGVQRPVKGVQQPVQGVQQQAQPVQQAVHPPAQPTPAQDIQPTTQAPPIPPTQRLPQPKKWGQRVTEKVEDQVRVVEKSVKQVAVIQKIEKHVDTVGKVEKQVVIKAKEADKEESEESGSSEEDDDEEEEEEEEDEEESKPRPDGDAPLAADDDDDDDMSEESETGSESDEEGSGSEEEENDSGEEDGEDEEVEQQAEEKADINKNQTKLIEETKPPSQSEIPPSSHSGETTV